MIKIGLGAYSTVFFNPEEKDRAFKTYSKSKEKLDYYILRELCLLKRVEFSPYIIKYISYDIDKRTLALPKYKEDLFSYIKRKGILRTETIKNVAYQIGMAIYHLHSNGIIHRDIKPHNVLINENMEIVLIDFGIARVLEHGRYLSEKSDTVVSSWYRPPEVFSKRDDYSFEVDIWSLGCVIAEMFLGETFLHSTEDGVIIEQIKFFGYPEYFDDSDCFNFKDTVKYNPKAWDKKFSHLSAEHRVFLRKFFETDYKERMNISDVLNSEFFNNENIVKNVNEVYEENLRTYVWDIDYRVLQKYREYREAFLKCITHLPMCEFFRCMDILDSCISKGYVCEENFFEYSHTALFMASKLESVCPVSTKTFINLTEIDKKSLEKTERNILTESNFDIIRPTLNDYFSFYMKDHNFSDIGVTEIKNILMNIIGNPTVYKYHPIHVIKSIIFTVTGDRITSEDGCEDLNDCLDWICEYTGNISLS